MTGSLYHAMSILRRIRKTNGILASVNRSYPLDSLYDEQTRHSTLLNTYDDELLKWEEVCNFYDDEDTRHSRHEMEVKCFLCNDEENFSRNDALTRHMRVVHPGLIGVVGAGN